MISTLKWLKYFFTPIALNFGEGASASAMSSAGFGSETGFGENFGTGVTNQEAAAAGGWGNVTGTYDTSISDFEASWASAAKDFGFDPNTGLDIGTTTDGYVTDYGTTLMADGTMVSHDAYGNISVYEDGKLTSVVNAAGTGYATFDGASTTSQSFTDPSNVSYTSSELAGMSYTYDTHYMANGQQLSFTGEMVADTVETFDGSIGYGVNDTMTPETAQAIGSVMEAAAGYAMGTRGIALAASGAHASIDTAIASGGMTHDEASGWKAAVTAISIFSALPAQMTAMNTALTAKGIPTAYRAVMGIQAGLGLYNSVNELGKIATGQYTGNTGLTSAIGSDAVAFGLYTLGMNVNINDARALLSAYDGFTAIRSSEVDVNSVQDDPFDWMAGGAKYEAQFAGGVLYQGDKVRDSKLVANQQFGLDDGDKIELFGTDGIYQNLEPVNTTIDMSQASATADELTYRQVAVLSREFNVELAVYNELVEEYNAEYAGKTYDSQQEYDNALAASTKASDKITSSGEELSVIQDRITELLT